MLFVANVGEEGEGNLSGMRYLCRQSSLASKIRAFIVLDGPTTDHITCQALASRRFEITFSGPGGHSWSDFGIGNPVHALSRAIAFFTDDPSTGSHYAESFLQLRDDRRRIEHQLDPDGSPLESRYPFRERRTYRRIGRSC